MQKSDEARFLKKKCVSKLFSILSPKQGFLAVFRHFLENASLVLANFAYINRLEHSLHFLLRHHARKKIRSPCFWPFCVQIRCFWQFFAIFSRKLHLFWLIFHIQMDWTILYTFCSDNHAWKNQVTLFLAILCPNYAFLVPFSNRVILGSASLYESVFMSK